VATNDFVSNFTKKKLIPNETIVLEFPSITNKCRLRNTQRSYQRSNSRNSRRTI